MAIPVLSKLGLARRFERSFVVPGVVLASTTWPGLFIPVAADETINLIAVRYKLLSGTSIAFTLLKNGSGMTGFTALSCTTTAQSATPTPIAMAADDFINFSTGAAVATPADMSISMYFESVV